jgi:DNA repair exonuclease SbcCD ATPase subunit
MLQQDLQNAELEKISQAKRIECLEDELQTVELEKSSQYEKLMLLEAQVKSLLTELDHRRLTTNAATTVGAATHDVTTSNGELDIESVHLALEWETFRNKAEFQQLKMECAELRQRVQDIEQEMKQSRRQNDELKADYVRLQESYRQLEQLKLNVEERENACHVNLTDAQKDIELTRIQLSTAQQELSELRAKHHDEVSALRSQLDDALDEYSILAYNSTVVSYCSSIPLAILLFVIAIAFHPLLSMLTATRSPT